MYSLTILPGYYWCFNCMLHQYTNKRTCPVCGEMLSFNIFTLEQVEIYNRMKGLTYSA